MYVDHSSFGQGEPRRWHELPDDEALLLWSLRRMVVAWPRCHAVSVALHRRYPETSLGIEHLLRCWLAALSRHARRPITIGDPNCTLLLPDEAAILLVLTHATHASHSGAVNAAIATLADSGGTCLLTLATALAEQLAGCR